MITIWPLLFFPLKRHWERKGAIGAELLINGTSLRAEILTFKVSYVFFGAIACFMCVVGVSSEVNHLHNLTMLPQSVQCCPQLMRSLGYPSYNFEGEGVGTPF